MNPTTLTTNIYQNNYAVIGTGALGGFYGAKLQKAGFDVHFLLRSDYEQVANHGCFLIFI